MKRFVRRGVFCLLAATATLSMQSSSFANERDRQFFRQAEGEWTGPGEIIAGKYKGTKFVCNFTGSTPGKKVGMTLDGGCRVGVFNQKMSATVELAGAGYRGKFLDGAAGKGMDIVSGNVVDGKKVVFGINRKQLKGAMVAKMGGDQNMVVTVSVKVADKMIPVIGMNLKRVDQTQVGSIAQ
jgi:hypothetical protein